MDLFVYHVIWNNMYIYLEIHTCWTPYIILRIYSGYFSSQGMRYLHSTPIRVHGFLTSRNCVIDARWVLKVTDYGLPAFYEAQNIVLPAKTARGKIVFTTISCFIFFFFMSVQINLSRDEIANIKPVTTMIKPVKIN